MMTTMKRPTTANRIRRARRLKFVRSLYRELRMLVKHTPAGQRGAIRNTDIVAYVQGAVRLHDKLYGYERPQFA